MTNRTEIAALITNLHAAQAQAMAAAVAVDAAHARLESLQAPSPAERATLQALDALKAAHEAVADLEGIKKDVCSRWAHALGPGHSVCTAAGTFTTTERTAWKGVAQELLNQWDPVAAHKLVQRHTKPSHRLTMAKQRTAQIAHLARLGA